MYTYKALSRIMREAYYSRIKKYQPEMHASLIKNGVVVPGIWAYEQGVLITAFYFVSYDKLGLKGPLLPQKEPKIAE